jgi:hypothetical protein
VLLTLKLTVGLALLVELIVVEADRVVLSLNEAVMLAVALLVALRVPLPVCVLLALSVTEALVVNEAELVRVWEIVLDALIVGDVVDESLTLKEKVADVETEALGLLLAVKLPVLLALDDVDDEALDVAVQLALWLVEKLRDLDSEVLLVNVSDALSDEVAVFEYDAVTLTLVLTVDVALSLLDALSDDDCDAESVMLREVLLDDERLQLMLDVSETLSDALSECDGLSDAVPLMVGDPLVLGVVLEEALSLTLAVALTLPENDTELLVEVEML